MGLQAINFCGCGSLNNLAALEHCPKLRFLNLQSCGSLRTLKGLEKCLQLYDLNLHDCRQLVSLQGLPRSEKFKHLNLFGCDLLNTLEGVEGCPALEDIYLPDNALLDLQSLQSCPKLKRVAFFGIPSDRLLVLEQFNQLKRLLCGEPAYFFVISDQLERVLRELKERGVLDYHRQDPGNRRLEILNQHYSNDWRPTEADQAWDIFFLDSCSFFELVARYDNA